MTQEQVMDTLLGIWEQDSKGWETYRFLGGEEDLAWVIHPLTGFLKRRFGLKPLSRALVVVTAEVVVRYDHFLVYGDLDNWRERLIFIARSAEGNRVLHEIAEEVERVVGELQGNEEARKKAYRAFFWWAYGSNDRLLFEVTHGVQRLLRAWRRTGRGL